MSLGEFRLEVDLTGDNQPFALVGPNGSGKTTLLRAIAGAYQPDHAEIEVGERVFQSSERGVNLPIERRDVGYVPQGYGLFDHLSVFENVEFGLKMRRLARDEREQRVTEALSELEILDFAKRTPGELSGGQQQRVALARALVIEPSILLLDEPMAALDAGARRTVRQFLAERLRQFDCPSIVATHDVRDVRALDARVCVLEDGQCVQEGDVDTICADPGTAFVAEFAGV